MQVLLIYDDRERKRYRPFLSMIVADAGGTLREVDRTHGAVAIESTFRELSRTADVILVDVTRANTNVGIEVGRFLRSGDRRLIVFSCSCDPLPFYLRGTRYYPLDAVVQCTEHSSEQANALKEAIREIGVRRPLETLGDLYTQEPSADVCRKLYESHPRVYRAPTSAFIFGEHAVTVGHPALHLPLPRYVFVCVQRSKGVRSSLRFMRHGASTDTECDDLEEPFSSRLARTLALWRVPPLDIKVWSELPTMCGLGTSSAIAACLALEVLGLEMAPSAGRDMSPHATFDLLASHEFDVVFRKAWQIDAAFHTFRGSGAGVFGALAGTPGPAPNLFFSEPRRTWNGDAGEFDRNLAAPDDEFPATDNGLENAHRRIEELRCVGFHTASGPSPFQSGHFALVYSGHTKKTGFSVTRVAHMARYFHLHGKMLRSILDGVVNAGLGPRYPLSQRMTETYRQNVDAGISAKYQRPEELEQHEGAVQETLYAAYACAALAGINSFWSGDDRFLALMNACQAVLEAMGLHEWTDDGVANYDLHHFASALNALQDSLGNRVCAAKITGGGMGGDLIVFSRESDPITFEQVLRQGILEAKSRLEPENPNLGKVHFSSTWIDGYPSAYRAEPAQLVRGEPAAIRWPFCADT